MVKYICNICKKDFNQKCHYVNHTEKKKYPCKPNNIIIIDKSLNMPKYAENNILNTENIPKKIGNINLNAKNVDNSLFINNDIVKNEKKRNYMCNFCEKTFSRSDHLKYHLDKACKIKKEENKEKEELLQLLLKQAEDTKKQQEQIEHLTNIINKLSNTTNNANNTNNNNTNTNTNTNSNNNINSNNSITNIKIEFGKEELKNIDKSVFYNALLKGSGAEIPSKLIEGIHFNENYKEYQNVYISDASRNKALVHNGKIWNIANADEVVDRLLDTTLIYAGSKHEELENEIAEKPKSVKNKITKEIKLMNLMKGKEEFEVDNDGNHIDIDGKIVDKKEFERGERLNIRAKEKIKLTLCNKKYIINKSDK